jgi:hypothetical protein
VPGPVCDKGAFEVADDAFAGYVNRLYELGISAG